MTPRLTSVVSCTILTDQMRCGVVWCGVVWCVVVEQHRDLLMVELFVLQGRDFLQVEASHTPLIMPGSSDWPHPIIYIVTLHCDTSHHLSISPLTISPSLYEAYNGGTATIR